MRGKRVDVWQRAVDTQRFNPSFRSHAMRQRLTDGHPDRVVLTYVGRIGSGAVVPSHRQREGCLDKTRTHIPGCPALSGPAG